MRRTHPGAVSRTSVTTRLLKASIICAAVATVAYSRVVHLRDYNTKEPRDRNVTFAMAITPNQEVLSLVAKRTGKWRLTRVANWLDQRPTEQTIDVPGWGQKDLTPGSMLWTSILITGDGHYAICVVHGFFPAGEGKKGGRSEDLVSVIDLTGFTVLRTIHSAPEGEESLAYYLDASGQIVLLASGATTGRHSERTVRMITMQVPAMKKIGECRYVEKMDSGTLEQRRDETCETMLRNAGSSPTSLDPFLASLTGGPPLPAPDGWKAGPCSSEPTKDGRFEVELCRRYAGWFDHHVTYRINVLARADHEPAGTLALTDRNSAQFRVGRVASRDFLLVMEGGTRLKVYEMIE